MKEEIKNILIISLFLLIIVSNISLLIKYNYILKKYNELAYKESERVQKVKKVAFKEISEWQSQIFSNLYLEKAIEDCFENNFSNVEEIINNLNEALKIRDIPICYYIKGNIYLKLKQYDKSLKSFDKYLEYIPSSSLAYLKKGIIFYKLKNYDKALENFKEALFNNPKLYKAKKYIEIINNKLNNKKIKKNKKMEIKNEK